MINSVQGRFIYFFTWLAKDLNFYANFGMNRLTLLKSKCIK